MAEVVGVAASVAGLVGLTMPITEVAMKYFSSIKHAKEQSQDLIRQLTALGNIFRDLQMNLITSPDLVEAFEERPSSVVRRLSADRPSSKSNQAGQVNITELCRKVLSAQIKEMIDGRLKAVV